MHIEKIAKIIGHLNMHLFHQQMIHNSVSNKIHTKEIQHELLNGILNFSSFIVVYDNSKLKSDDYTL